jgi:hypothetical protein
VQVDFEWYHSKKVHEDQSFDQGVHEIAVLLVLSKFVQLVGSAIGSGKLIKRVHRSGDCARFDIIGRFEP